MGAGGGGGVGVRLGKPPGGPRREPPATPDTATSATRSHGVSRALLFLREHGKTLSVLFFLGRLRGVVAGVAGRLLLSPVCWRNSKWWCSATPPGGSHQSTDRTAKPRGTATSCRPHRKTLEDRAVATENPEAALEAVPGARHWTRPLPPWLPGATEGNQGESTGTGGNPQPQRRESRQVPVRQHARQRQLFRFSQLPPNGAASGTCNRPGIAKFHRPVLHFCLTAPIEVVRERLTARGEPQGDPAWSWVHRRAAECCVAHQSPAFAMHIPADRGSPAMIAAELAALVR
jgi:hypothetical protein